MDIKPGGTQGGGPEFMWALGLLLSGVAAYFFFDSVNANTNGAGVISGAMRGGGHRGGGHGMWHTTSMGIIFLPLFIAVVALFVDSTYKWAWGLLWIGFGIIVVEILSRLRFEFHMKTSHLILLIVVFAAGMGIMIRALRADSLAGKPADKSDGD